MNHSFKKTNHSLHQKTLDGCYFPISLSHLDTINGLDVAGVTYNEGDQEHHIYLLSNRTELADYIAHQKAQK